ncbi:14604_t:CDS:2, partial [Racocetra fulgida]
MTGRGNDQDSVQTSDTDDENNLLITESSGAQQSRKHSENNNKRVSSAGLINSSITPRIIEEQIDKVYDRLFSHLKSKVQQAKSVILSISVTIDDDYESYIIITYDWLTEDFEFYRLFMHVKNWPFGCYTFVDDINEALISWELTNLKFITCNSIDFDYFDDFYSNLEDEIENIIICVIGDSGNGLIMHSLKRWAKNAQEISNQGISDIITAVLNATKYLSSVVEFLKDKRTLRAMQ